MNKNLKLVGRISIYIFAIVGLIATIIIAITLSEVVKQLKSDSTDSNANIELLKKSRDYSIEKSNILPIFQYDTTDLYKVREFFELDTLVLGIENQWEKVLKIEKWLDANISHDGSHSYFGPKNAIDIWKYSKENNQGVNCRMLAITLHEIYLALGMKARYITCMPKNLTDRDCHVINEVWIDDLQKWVWIDPSFSAYLTDKDNNLLSIQEVRKMMIADEKLILNKDANWNGQTYSEEKYLPYMTKNLYWFTMPSIFGYNVETKDSAINSKKISITLYPESAKYTTNNDSYFWQH